ncbi:hypothetical protein SLUN_02755 [Streptomyces lunaelactis]|uniref:Uncharacterized protein n=1 Tax=Streptomyces lunaelactis TaxID=1535768 RepID=A0A2R4SWT6_9ACTN|nr:hypothetical protein [Streptomyces lunaelactis]AVZ71304.1 hypothetical protein SLUN_02755 [Streptomyces lunaelactis]NUK87548.1 hypothetical protein [Streptomyces lunaelactis]NUL04004.1 hypothetical protein [Streptomyces lunaelactis]
MTALDQLAGADVLFPNWRDPSHPQAGGAEAYCYEIAGRPAAVVVEEVRRIRRRRRSRRRPSDLTVDSSAYRGRHPREEASASCPPIN